ncbi:MAG TPA: hypothetical protein VIY66_05730, partial [Candidatus Acidoferrales bacterium]
NYEFVRRFLAETPPDQVRPPRLLDGDDLIGLGLKPGPQFKAILERVEEAQLDGTVNDRAGAIRLARDLSNL